MNRRKESNEMAGLVSALCEEYLTQAQLDRLNVLLATDRGARAQYLSYMSAEASYERLLGGAIGLVEPDQFTGNRNTITTDDLLVALDAPKSAESLSFDDLWRFPAGQEPAAPEAPVTRLAPTPAPLRTTPFRRTSPPPRGRGSSPLFRGAAAAAILTAMGLAAWLLLQRANPVPVARTTEPAQPLSVAVMMRSVAAQWGGSKFFSPGEMLPTGEIDLQSGVAKVGLPGGAAVVIEGPAKFDVRSATNISLLAGRLVATVPHNVRGFTVTTPTGNVVDLGTIFGVEVLRDEPTRTEVFDGRVQMEPLSAANSAITLSAGQAARLSATATVIDPAGAMPQHFVSDPGGGGALSLDVADLVAGGDGTTHLRSGMIDPETGAAGPMSLKGAISTDSSYHRVPSLPVIDGCFIPNGAKGPVQVDSAGHLFALPATDGKTYDRIFSGNHVPRPGSQRKRPIPTVLEKVDYSKPQHWFLYLHANVGLTFDLAALRRLHPGSDVRQFKAIVGNVRGENPNKPRPAELFVLADGILRFHRLFEGYEVFTANVPLSDADRSLSIIITDAGKGAGGDDIMLGDPVFEMQARP